MFKAEGSFDVRFDRSIERFTVGMEAESGSPGVCHSSIVAHLLSELSDFLVRTHFVTVSACVL